MAATFFQTLFLAESVRNENLEVFAHQELLSRALDNVLRKALRYGGCEEITISAHNSDGKVKISVTDKGEFPRKICRRKALK